MHPLQPLLVAHHPFVHSAMTFQRQDEKPVNIGTWSTHSGQASPAEEAPSPVRGEGALDAGEGKAKGDVTRGGGAPPAEEEPSPVRGEGTLDAGEGVRKSLRPRWADIEVEAEDYDVDHITRGFVDFRGETPPLRFNRINIKNMDNDSTRSVVYNSQRDSLGWLRMQIKKKFKIPIDQQRITLYKTVLEGDGRLLSTCNLHDESLVHVSDMRKLQVHVKTLTHDTLHMTVPPSLEVSVFMQRVGCLATLHPSQMWLTYSVHTMLSTNRLQDVKH